MQRQKHPSYQTVTVQRIVKGGYGENQQYIEAGEVLVATVTDGSIQPISGRDRATASQGGFDSDYFLFAKVTNITFEDGFFDIQAGDFIYDSKGHRYKINFPGDWTDHYQMELKSMPVVASQVR